ncbi:hypothetical protein [Nocardiopsis kunsanensis]|uniref:DUF5668 domain-containing protein n=1 Tax=Nocardiopsis kunsanensis TaxID=141693 RepID=A0A918XB99_9ACTN|nr:hypothetical protein [Nocardiopsis kunsanensis]GHD23962.1 hypothetical protein GCM10007147_19810 [Nocardiopsis kunsanensis]
MADRGTDWGSVVAGLLFVGLAVAFVLRGTGDWSFSVWWVLPVLVVGLLLAAVARRLSRRTASAETGVATEPESRAEPED